MVRKEGATGSSPAGGAAGVSRDGAQKRAMSKATAHAPGKRELMKFEFGRFGTGGANGLRLFRMLCELHFAEAAHAAHFHPLDNVNVAGVIEASAVRTDEFAGREMVPAEWSVGYLVSLGVFAEFGDELFATIH